MGTLSAGLGVRSWVREADLLAMTLLLGYALPALSDEGGRVGDPQSLVAEALAYEHGEGVPKDYMRAAELYCRAARKGDREAQFNLGWMYANGRGVARDDGIAAGLFGLAAAQGHEHAIRMQRFVGESSVQLPKCYNELDHELLEISAEEAAVLRASPEHWRIFELVRDIAPEYKVSPRLALAIIRVESNFNPKARSPKDAQGLMQLIPETSARFNVRNAYDPVQNLRGGLAYLRWLLAYFRGDVALVAAGYNAGEKAVDRYRGVPPYDETRGYVKRILKLFRQEEHPYDATITDASPALRAAVRR